MFCWKSDGSELVVTCGWSREGSDCDSGERMRVKCWCQSCVMI